MKALKVPTLGDMFDDYEVELEKHAPSHVPEWLQRRLAAQKKREIELGLEADDDGPALLWDDSENDEDED